MTSGVLRRVGALLIPAALFCQLLTGGSGTRAQVAPTPKTSLEQFTATAGPQGVLIEWRTTFELDNLGFNIIRERKSRKEQLNLGIIPGSALMIGAGHALTGGHTYSRLDPKGTLDCKYYLEDIDLNGRHTLHGAETPKQQSNLTARVQAPVVGDELTSQSGVLQRESSETAVTKGLEVTTDAISPTSLSDQWGLANQPALKIGVRVNGWYRITQPEMAGAGFDTTSDARNLRLFVNATEVPILVSRDTGPLTSTDYLEFWGEGLDLPSTDTQVYWLINGTEAGERILRVNDVSVNSDSLSQSAATPTAVPTSPPPWSSGVAFGVMGVPQTDSAATPVSPTVRTAPEAANRQAGVIANNEVSSSPDERLAGTGIPDTNEHLESAPKVLSKKDSVAKAGIPVIANDLKPLTASRPKALRTNWKRARSSVRKSRSRRRRKSSYRNHVSMPAATTPGFMYKVEREDRFTYATAILNGDKTNFFGSIVVNSSSLPVTLNLKDIARSSNVSPRLQVSLQGLSAVNHQINIFLNDSLVGTIQFAGATATTQSLLVPLSFFVEGDNVVRMLSTASGDTSIIDTVGITYPRAFNADNDLLQFSARPADSPRVEGFTNANIRVFDVTDTAAVQEIKPIVEPSNSGYAAIIPAGGSGKTRRLVASSNAPLHPLSLVLNQPSTLNSGTNGADFVIIAYKDFIPSLTTPMAPAGVSLINQREAQGFTVKVVDVDDVYDEFSYGIHTSTAIRDFLSLATTSWSVKPRYVLLLGDASYDPRNFLNEGVCDFVPSKHVDTLFMEADSDDSLADFDNDGVPEISVGRLPARTLAQANLMVSKIVNFSPSNVPQVPLMVADWPNGYVFTDFSEHLLTLLPSNMQSAAQRVYRPPCATSVSSMCETSDASAHADIINKINSGVALVNYSGHGNVDIWAGPILTASDALALNNGNKLPFVVVMDCLNGFFSDPLLEGMGESLMKAPNGGAVAAFASSGLTIADPQHAMGQRMFELLYQGSSIPIGDASRQSKAATGDLDVRRTWILFGDPTMKIR